MAQASDWNVNAVARDVATAHEVQVDVLSCATDSSFHNVGLLGTSTSRRQTIGHNMRRNYQ